MSLIDRVTSAVASAVRGGNGSRVVATSTHPTRRLVLYEMENCPYSRKVRETLAMLDLDAEIRPCPEHDRNHRPDLARLTGKEQIPLLIDPNTGSTISDSDRIVKYLFDTYADGHKPPISVRPGKLGVMTSKLASKLRGSRSTEAEPARRPREPLDLWGYEASPETRLIREELCRFALPYISHSVARGSAKRDLAAESSKIPLLVDPNTGARLVGAREARRYLARTYGIAERPARAVLPPRPASHAPA